MTLATVFIVDDDPGIRYSVALLLETADLRAECFASAEDFLQECDLERAGCLLLDVRMPGLGGLELQEVLAQRRMRLPIIFLTAHADLAAGVAAMKQGALDFLIKPVNGAVLLQRIQAALARDREQRRAAAEKRAFEARLEKLTGREREVLVLALAGLANRDISARLGISLRTIEGHRSRIYLKTGVDSLLELARHAANAGVVLA